MITDASVCGYVSEERGDGEGVSHKRYLCLSDTVGDINLVESFITCQIGLRCACVDVLARSGGNGAIDKLLLIITDNARAKGIHK